MPETSVLYSVTAAVVVGLVAWVAVVLKTAKEPWARETPPQAPSESRGPDVPIERDPAHADAKADVAADAKADVEPDAKADVEPGAKADVAPDAKTES